MAINRRCVMRMIAAVTFSGMSTISSLADGIDAKRVIDNFTKIKSMAGEFVQFDYKGDQTEGTFALLRPGMARFDYRKKSGLNIIADGKTVAVENKSLKTWNLYPLSRTPLSLLLANQIDLSNGMIKYVVERDGLIAVLLADQKTFGNSTIELLLDKDTSELRQYTITDEARRETTVLVHNVRINSPLPKHIFRIPYKDIRQR